MTHLTPRTILISLAAVVVFSITVGGVIFGAEGRYESKGTAMFAQAQTAVELQIVAKESRKRDLEVEIGEIDKRAQAGVEYILKGDAQRRDDLADQRLILIQRLEQLK